MSATGFHPEPSANAPWTRTTVLTAAYAGDDAVRAAPVKRARIKHFMVQLHVVIRVVSYFGALPMNFGWRSFYARHELRFASIPIREHCQRNVRQIFIPRVLFHTRLQISHVISHGIGTLLPTE